MRLWSKRLRIVLLTLLLTAGSVSMMSVSGCKEEGPMEKAGEELDEAGEEIQDEIDDATTD